MASDELTDWTKGDPLAAAHLQQPISILRKMLSSLDGQVARLRLSAGGFTFAVTLGKIVIAGPGGAADFTAEQYWVKPQYVSNQKFQNQPVLLGDITPAAEHTEDEEPASDSNVKAVTNLPELSRGSHSLEPGRYVWFFGLTDGQDNPVEHFYMNEGFPIGKYQGTFPQMVTQNQIGYDFALLHAPLI